MKDKFKVADDVLNSLRSKVQGLLADKKILEKQNLTLLDLSAPEDVSTSLEEKSKDNSKVRVIMKTDDSKIITFPIKGYLHFNVLKTAGAKTSTPMADAIAKKGKLLEFKVVRVEDSLDKGKKIFPIWNYEYFQKISTEYYLKNPNNSSEDFYKVNQNLKSKCILDGKILDETINYKDIFVTLG